MILLLSLRRGVIPFLFLLNTCSSNKMITNKKEICTSENICLTNLVNKENNDREKVNIIEVVYGYDALCGWCYGFSKELEKAKKLLKGEVKFKLVNSGIFADQRSIPMGHISEHIKYNAPRVTQMSGIKFGKNFMRMLENVEYPYNSKKASIAVVVFREMYPEKTFEFASAIQEAFFYKGQDIQLNETYINLIERYPIDKKVFLEKLNNNYYKLKTEVEFKETESFGFTGYPSSILIYKGKKYVINQGYVSSEVFIRKTKEIIKQLK